AFKVGFKSLSFGSNWITCFQIAWVESSADSSSEADSSASSEAASIPTGALFAFGNSSAFAGWLGEGVGAPRGPGCVAGKAGFGLGVTGLDWVTGRGFGFEETAGAAAAADRFTSILTS